MLLYCRPGYTCVSCALSRHAPGSLTDLTTDATTSGGSAGNSVFGSIGGTHIDAVDV